MKYRVTVVQARVNDSKLFMLYSDKDCWHLFTENVYVLTQFVTLKKLNPDKFFVGKPSQNYNCVTQFYLQPDISKLTPP